MKPRSCWAVLAKKAKDDEESAQDLHTQVRKKVEHLRASRQRMDDLLNDYKRRAIENQAKVHSMADASIGTRTGPPGKGRCRTRDSRSKRSAVPRIASAMSLP